MLVSSEGIDDKGKRERYNNSYECDWCSKAFFQIVGKIDNASDVHSNVSDQVICPKCKNIIKTWK